MNANPSLFFRRHLLSNPPMHGGDGFTLPELLVAIFIFSLIGLGSWQLLSQANLNIKIQENKSNKLAEINRAINQLSDDMQFLVSRSQRVDRYEQSLGFEGDNKGFQLVRIVFPSPTDEPRSNLAAIRYQYGDTALTPDSSSSLVRWVNQYLDGRTEASATSRAILSGLDRFEIKYLDQENAYHSEWPPVALSLSGNLTQPDSVEVDSPALALPRAIHMSFDIESVGSIYRIFEISAGSEDPTGNGYAG